MEIAYVDFNCYKTIVRDGNEFSGAVYFHYRDGEVTSVEVNHTTVLVNDNHSFKEVDDFNNLELKEVKTSVENNKTTYTIDFEKYPQLRNNEVLSYYSRGLGGEEEYMQENKYSCNAKSRIEKELIDVKTRKKIENK